MEKQKVPVGIGVLINKNDAVLLGLRKNSHGENTWSLPGGHLEFGETFEQCVIREVKEETDLDVSPEKVISLSNDIMYSKHYVTIGITAHIKGGTVRLMEPQKCAQWKWFPINDLPDNLFLASKYIIELYQQKTIVRPLS